MNFKFNKKVIISAVVLLALLLATFYFGFIISKFNKNTLSKPSAPELIYAAYPEKSAYYSYSVFYEKFYGPYDKENVKEGDYYVKFGVPQGSGAYSSLHVFDKNKRLIKTGGDAKCDFGNFYYSGSSLYMRSAGKFYKINPELDFACFPLNNDEYEKLSLKIISLENVKNGDTLDVSGYKYFDFDRYYGPNYLNSLHSAPKKGKKLELKIFYDDSNNVLQDNVHITITSKK